MKTMHLDVDRAGPMVCQEGFRRLEVAGTVVLSGDGEPIWLARIVVPGVARTAYGPAAPGLVRLKATGEVPPSIEPGAIRLRGKTTVTRWSTRSGRDRRSEMTMSAERVEQTDDLPALSGLLPVRWPVSDPAVLIASEPMQDGQRHRLTVMLPGVIDGLAEVVAVAPYTELVGRPVDVVLGAKLIVPEAEDVSAASKAAFALEAESISPHSTGRGRRSTQSETNTNEPVEA